MGEKGGRTPSPHAWGSFTWVSLQMVPGPPILVSTPRAFLESQRSIVVSQVAPLPRHLEDTGTQRSSLYSRPSGIGSSALLQRVRAQFEKFACFLEHGNY